MSFDLNSLYPHLIMQYNMSPETLVTGDYMKLTVDNMLQETKVNLDIPENVLSHQTVHCIATDKLGFFQR